MPHAQRPPSPRAIITPHMDADRAETERLIIAGANLPGDRAPTGTQRMRLNVLLTDAERADPVLTTATRRLTYRRMAALLRALEDEDPAALAALRAAEKSQTDLLR